MVFRWSQSQSHLDRLSSSHWETLLLAPTLTFCTTFINSLYTLSFSGACLNSDVQICASVEVRHLNIYRY